jgi:nicotinamidase-related amidase
VEDIRYNYQLDEKGPWGISLKSWLKKESLALMIIDMQNYMTSPCYSGKWSASGSDDYYYHRLENIVLPNIQKLISKCRSLGIKIILLRIASTKRDLSDVPGITRKRLADELYDREGKGYHLYHDEKPVKSIQE